MKVIALSVTALLLAAGASRGQEYLDKILKDQSQKVVSAVIGEDRYLKELSLVKEVISQMEERHEEFGAPKEKMRNLVYLSWLRLRGAAGVGATKDDMLKSNEQLTQKQLVEHAEGYGYLVVKTTPEDAEVTLGNLAWGRTKTDGWERVGSHPIEITKMDYKKVKDRVKIEKRKANSYTKDLEKE